MEKTTIVGNGCGVLGIRSITVHPSHIVPAQQQMHFPIQFLFRGFGANFVTLLLTTQLQILLHFGVNTSKTCLPVQLYKPNPKIAVLNFLTLKTKPASSSIIKEEEKEGEDVQSNENKKDEKEEEELQSNDEEEEEGELHSNEKEDEEEIQSNEVQRTSAFVCSA
jgi:hypothetical protein